MDGRALLGLASGPRKTGGRAMRPVVALGRRCGRGEIGRRSRLHWSARVETPGVEPLKFGESWDTRPCRSRAKPGPGWEGVETRRAAPKPQGHGEGIVQTTNARIGRRRKPKWYENLLSERECGFESRRPHQELEDDLGARL